MSKGSDSGSLHGALLCILRSQGASLLLASTAQPLAVRGPFLSDACAHTSPLPRGNKGALPAQKHSKARRVIIILFAFFLLFVFLAPLLRRQKATSEELRQHRSLSFCALRRSGWTRRPSSQRSDCLRLANFCIIKVLSLIVPRGGKGELKPVMLAWWS